MKQNSGMGAISFGCTIFQKRDFLKEKSGKGRRDEPGGGGETDSRDPSLL